MTNREKQFAALGIYHFDGIDMAQVVVVPSSGREIHRVVCHGWEARAWNDDYRCIFADLLDAVRFATSPLHGGVAVPSALADERALAIQVR